MATTPPHTSMRVRTPPTPLHGAAYDNYEPYSPRRSTRSTAHSNPYSSFNSDRSPNTLLQPVTTPPTTIKRARFARAPTQLSSPPSSPVSPVKRHALHKTPRKQTLTPRKVAATGTHSDSDAAPSNSHLAPPIIDPVTMLPTPSKTPKKRPAAAITSARILNFQPHHLNDVMPSRKIRKQSARQHNATAGFELYDEHASTSRGVDIDIYTDANSRIPEMDQSEDNPFVGRKRNDVRPQRRRSRKTVEEVERDGKIEEAVKRDEGVTYVFRGKKIFRRFSDRNPDVDSAPSSPAGTDISGTPSQRRLKRQAGIAAQRPLTRSAIKPRLLFPSEEQQLERERREIDLDDIDEEAVTDIDMPSATSPDTAQEDLITPVKDQFRETTPPPTVTRSTKAKGKKATPDAEMSASGVEEASTSTAGKRKGNSPFDSWQRTKLSAAGRKRAGEESGSVGQGGGKRTRSTLIESPA